MFLFFGVCVLMVSHILVLAIFLKWQSYLCLTGYFYKGWNTVGSCNFYTMQRIKSLLSGLMEISNPGLVGPSRPFHLDSIDRFSFMRRLDVGAHKTAEKGTIHLSRLFSRCHMVAAKTTRSLKNLNNNAITSKDEKRLLVLKSKDPFWAAVKQDLYHWSCVSIYMLICGSPASDWSKIHQLV